MTDEAVGGVVKVIEVVGSSPHSFSDAVRNAVRTAGQSLRNLRGVEVLSTTAEIRGTELTNYKAQCKIAFVLERSDLDTGGEVHEAYEAMGSQSVP